jgi:hypothetical protein
VLLVVRTGGGGPGRRRRNVCWDGALGSAVVASKHILRKEFQDGITVCYRVIPGGLCRQCVHITVTVDVVLPYLIPSASLPLYSLGHPFRGSPAMMESVDCWPLATTLIQTLEGKPFPVTVLLDVIDLWYPSALLCM